MKNIFLLDMDATLLDFGRAEEENFSMTLGAVGVPPDGETYARYHEINDGLWKALERGEIGRERLKVERFERLFAEKGIRADASAASAFYFKNFENICYPFEGALRFLKELSARGRVYIVTNGGVAIQRSHIRMAGFGPYLDGVFISEEIGADKPSEGFADYVASHIENFHPARALYVGDSLTSDKLCAEVLGAEFVLFRPDEDPAAQYEAILNRIR